MFSDLDDKIWLDMLREQVSNYTVIFQPEEDGGYSVFVPALPGCFTQGETLEEARAMAREAIQLCIESLQVDGETVPDDTGIIIERMRV